MRLPSRTTTFLTVALAGTTWAATSHKSLESRIANLFAECPAIERGRVGFKFIDLANGTVLAERNAAEFFVPASNTKLYTTALALARLGPQYRFQTELRTSGIWQPGQTSLRDLQLIGGGDPNLSGRILPYRVDAQPGDPLDALRDVAKKLADTGIRTIEGDVTGVATRYPGPLYPDGWTIDDSVYDYGAPVSALTFNDNAVSIKLFPTTPGELTDLETTPANTPLLFLNETVTDSTSQARVHLYRAPGSNEVIVWGTLGKNAEPYGEDLAVQDPAQWAASALIDALREQGITVLGNARSRYESLNELGADETARIRPTPAGTLLVVHQSAPLSEAVTVVNKISQNLHAEMLLREVGYVARGVGTQRAGLDERTKFLEELGITLDGTGVTLQDGSGLARQDLTTPASTVRLLQAMWQRPEHDVWLASLPMGGVDGTLEHRFKNIRGAERVHAKTGSLSHVNAMSGYIETREHSWLAFSIMVNETAGHDAEVKTFIDRLCAIFLGA